MVSLVGTGRFDIALSVPLVLEYEGVADRMLADLPLSAGDLSDILDYLCSVAIHRPVFFLWRPTLPDPKDDMVLGLAVDAGAPRGRPGCLGLYLDGRFLGAYGYPYEDNHRAGRRTAG